MRRIISHLKQKYDPVGLICYGSYCDGTQSAESDFDALLICRDGECCHDMEIVGGVKLDVFVYPEADIRDGIHPEELIQIHDGKVVLDQTGTASQLLRQIRDYVAAMPVKTPEAKTELKNWCDKMMARAKRTDAEGLYRAHWLLADSLQIYCDMRDRFYFGPKKTIKWLQENDTRGYELLILAVQDLNRLENWITYIFDNK